MTCFCSAWDGLLRWRRAGNGDQTEGTWKSKEYEEYELEQLGFKLCSAMNYCIRFAIKISHCISLCDCFFGFEVDISDLVSWGATI